MSGSTDLDTYAITKLFKNLRKMILASKTPKPLPELQLQPFSPSVSTMNNYIIGMYVEYNVLKNYTGAAGEEGKGDGHPPSKFIISEGYRLEDGATWQLVINPNFLDKNGRRYISALISIKDYPSNVPFVDISYTIRILDPFPDNSTAYQKASRIRRFSKQDSLFGWDKFIPFEALGDNPPSTIRFVVNLSILQEMDYPSSTEAADFWYSKHFADFVIPEKCCRDDVGCSASEKKNQNQNLALGPMSNASRKKNLQRLWNGGQLLMPNAVIKCKNSDIPIHAEILSELSTAISEHFAKQEDGFNYQPFRTDDKIDPEIMRMLVTFAYCGKFDGELETATFFGPNPIHNPTFMRLLNLWDASVLLKMTDLEQRLCDRIMGAVRVNFFHIPFLKYRQKIKSLEGRVATRMDFFGYLKQLRQKGSRVMEDYSTNRLAYSELMFKDSGVKYAA